MQLLNRWVSSLFLASLALVPSSAHAQGLLFNLPDDGTAVEYEGNITLSAGPEDNNPLVWTSELSIKSVGREEAEYKGTVQPCRWIEIKVITGKSEAAGIDPGPVGARIYKVLVPESRIMPDRQDSDGIPNDVLPIVKGFRRLGENEIKEIRSPGLVIYPTISLLTNYDSPEVVANADVPEVLAQGLSVTAKHMKGVQVMERPESRSTNTGEYWVSSEIPFGLARWVVSITTETKETTSPRSEFRLLQTRQTDMKLKRIRQNAESELITP
ncbi:MAG: hypothetical protein R3C20_17960 [Planctomycetaceae bacterium]